MPILTKMDDLVVGLYDLNCQISACVEEHFSMPIWVSAEVVGLSENRTGHCYLELMEKNDDGVIVAKAKATIWASLYRQIKPYFLREKGMPLAVGMTVAYSSYSGSNGTNGSWLWRFYQRNK